MDDAVYEKIFAVEDRHWWFRAKRTIVLSLLERYVTGEASKPRVADVGCGCGAMLEAMRDRFDAVGVDDSPLARAFCARRGLGVELGSLPDRIPLPEEHFDAVLMLDVLEHIDDDAASTHAAARLLKPGGVMICTSPAYPMLWSYWDEIHHHKRRYTLGPWRKLFVDAGLKLEACSYMNTGLFPLAAAQRLLSRVRPGSRSGDMPVPPALINAAFGWIFAMDRHYLGRIRLPWGLSVVAVARKTAR